VQSYPATKSFFLTKLDGRFEQAHAYTVKTGGSEWGSHPPVTLITCKLLITKCAKSAKCAACAAC